MDVLFSPFCQLHLQLVLWSALLVPLPRHTVVCSTGSTPQASTGHRSVSSCCIASSLGRRGCVFIWMQLKSFCREEGNIPFPGEYQFPTPSPSEYLELVKIWGPEIHYLLGVWIWEMYVNLFKLKFPSLQKEETVFHELREMLCLENS